MAWTLDKISREVRLITGVYSDDISDDRLKEMIQDFWTISFPAVIKTESLKGHHYLLTRVGKTVYPFPDNFVALNPTAFCDSYSVNVYYDSSILDLVIYNWIEETIPLGEEEKSSFNFQLRHFADPESICVFTNSDALFYQSNQVLYNYETKTISFNLGFDIDNKSFLKVKYKTTQVGRPDTVVVTDSNLFIYPIPDGNYTITIAGVKRPDPLPESMPILNIPLEFFNLIVYGTALKLLSLIDRDAYSQLYPIYKRYESEAMAKTYYQLTYTQTRGI